MLLVREFLKKIDINSLYICPHYLYSVTTLPWEIQKRHSSTVLFIQTSDSYVISEETNCNCCTAAYLITYCCLLLPIICLALFYGQFLISLVSHFLCHQCQTTTGSFQSHQHLEERNITCSQIKSFTFYKVVWWHLSSVVGKGVTVCFFLR